MATCDTSYWCRPGKLLHAPVVKHKQDEMFLADCCKLPRRANSSKLDASDELDLFTFAIEAGGQRWLEITVRVTLFIICTFLYSVCAHKDSITALFAKKSL